MNQADVTQTDITQTDVTQTDITQTDVTQTDVNANRTDANQTDANQTDANQTDANQTDVNANRTDANANQTDANQTDANQADANRTDANRTDANQAETTPDPVPQTRTPRNTTSPQTNQSKVAKQLETVNLRLKVAQLGVQLEQRGQKLSLRGTFPPRPNSGRMRSHQQRLSLGIPATLAGLKEGERQAKIIAAQLLAKTFNWHPYLVWSPEARRGEGGLQQQLKDFEDYFWQQPQRSAKPAASRTTWTSAYSPYVRKLATIAAAKPHLTTGEAIYATIDSFPHHSRSRQLCCTALAALGDFLQLELPLNLKTLGGSYNPTKTQARTLPDDGAIASHWEQIPNPTWRFVYGIMATYGLRNHEVFFCDYDALLQGVALPTVRVLSTTKTGEHEVWPFLPDWIDRFHLRQVCLPPINTDLTETTLQAIGQRVTRQFRRYQIPFSPYDLRHAWAVRTIHLGLADTVAAKMMGHSVSIHTRTYHRWITHRDQQQAVEAALNRLNKA